MIHRGTTRDELTRSTRTRTITPSNIVQEAQRSYARTGMQPITGAYYRDGTLYRSPVCGCMTAVLLIDDGWLDMPGNDPNLLSAEQAYLWYGLSLGFWIGVQNGFDNYRKPHLWEEPHAEQDYLLGWQRGQQMRRSLGWPVRESPVAEGIPA